MGGKQRRHAMLGVWQVDGRVPRATTGVGRDEAPTEVPSAGSDRQAVQPGRDSRRHDCVGRSVGQIPGQVA